MRERSESGPSVPISGALSEFIIEAHPSVISAGAGPLKTSQRRSWPVAKRAAAVLAMVPAKILIGASMAVAAVGGAQAFGVVDVPLLPGPGPSVVTTIPAEPVPSETSDAPAKPVPTTVPSGSTSKAATETHRTIPPRPAVNEAPVTSPPTLPPQAAVEGAPGCEFGQDTSARPTAAPPTDPCAPGAAEGTDNAPPEPAAAAGAPASVPRNNAANHATPTPTPAANSGRASDASSAVEKASTTNPAQNSGQGRTPPGD